MKKFKFFFLIMAAIAVMTSCASVNGMGKGISTNEQIARDKAEMNAMVDASRTNKVTVSETSKMETTDVDGRATTTYKDTRTLETNATLANVERKTRVEKRGKNYNATAKINAKIVEE